MVGMKRILLGSVCVSALLLAPPLLTAQAADMGVKPPPAPPAEYNWTGFYIGVQGGYAAGWSEYDTATPYLANAFFGGGGFGGGTVGFNYEFGATHVVAGVEGEFNGASITGSNVDVFGNSHSTSLHEFGSVDLRLGWALTGFAWDRMYLYMVGGAAFGDPNQTFKTPSGLSTSFSSGDSTGWDFGAGVEYAVTANWTVRGEWRMYDFGSASFSPNTIIPVQHGSKDTINTGRLGVAYKF